MICCVSFVSTLQMRSQAENVQTLFPTGTTGMIFLLHQRQILFYKSLSKHLSTLQQRERCRDSFSSLKCCKMTWLIAKVTAALKRSTRVEIPNVLGGVEARQPLFTSQLGKGPLPKNERWNLRTPCAWNQAELGIGWTWVWSSCREPWRFRAGCRRSYLGQSQCVFPTHQSRKPLLLFSRDAYRWCVICSLTNTENKHSVPTCCCDLAAIPGWLSALNCFTSAQPLDFCVMLQGGRQVSAPSTDLGGVYALQCVCICRSITFLRSWEFSQCCQWHLGVFDHFISKVWIL